MVGITASSSLPEYLMRAADQVGRLEGGRQQPLPHRKRPVRQVNATEDGGAVGVGLAGGQHQGPLRQVLLMLQKLKQWRLIFLKYNSTFYVAAMKHYKRAVLYFYSTRSCYRGYRYQLLFIDS